MSLLADVTPTNLAQERERFFASADFSYNPQFTYTKLYSQSELQKWGTPSAKIADQIKTIIPQLPRSHPHKSEPNLTQNEIAAIIESFFATIGLENQLETIFAPDFISRCKLGPGRIMFRLPITYTKSAFMGTVYHEIGTHYLRRLNNRHQPWTSNFRPDISFRETEEGLATLHTYLGTKIPTFFSTYSSYYGLYLSHTLPFNQAYQQILAINIRPDRAWQLVLRGKRGIKDTSQPIGGLSKDISYLHGALKVWQWLKNDQNNPQDLYLGRIGLEELDQRVAQANKDNIYYPPFMSDIAAYRQQILEFGQQNLFESFSANELMTNR